MTLIDYFENENISYDNLVTFFQQKAAKAKEALTRFSIDPKKDVGADVKLPPIELCSIYQDLCFFPDREVLAAFRKFNFKKNHLHWFIPITEIIDEINRINERGRVLISPKSFLSIVFFIHTKILRIWTDQIRYNNRKMSPFQIQELKFERRTRTNKKKIKKFDADIHYLAQMSNEIPSFLNIVRRLSQDDMENFFLHSFYIECSNKNSSDIYDDATCLELYDLYQRLSQDKYLAPSYVLSKNDHDSFNCRRGDESINAYKIRNVRDLMKLG